MNDHQIADAARPRFMTWMAAALLVMTPALIFAAPPPADTVTTLEFTPAASVPAGSAASAVMTVKAGGNPVNGVGTLTLQFAGAGNTPTSCASQTGESWHDVATASGTPNASGQVTIDLQALGLTNTVGTFGYRAQFTGGTPGYASSASSPCLDLTITEPGPPTCGTGVTIAASRTSGNGTPAPGSTNTWVLNMKVVACEDVTHLSAQGGLNAWATNSLGTPDEGEALVRKVTGNGKNSTIQWFIPDLLSPGGYPGVFPAGEANLEITVTGTIKPNTACGTVLGLLGSWSALYSTDGGATIVKTLYTGTSNVVVTCP